MLFILYLCIIDLMGRRAAAVAEYKHGANWTERRFDAAHAYYLTLFRYVTFIKSIHFFMSSRLSRYANIAKPNTHSRDGCNLGSTPMWVLLFFYSFDFRSGGKGY